MRYDWVKALYNDIRNCFGKACGKSWMNAIILTLMTLKMLHLNAIILRTDQSFSKVKHDSVIVLSCFWVTTSSVLVSFKTNAGWGVGFGFDLRDWIFVEKLTYLVLLSHWYVSQLSPNILETLLNTYLTIILLHVGNN